MKFRGVSECKQLTVSNGQYSLKKISDLDATGRSPCPDSRTRIGLKQLQQIQQSNVLNGLVNEERINYSKEQRFLSTPQKNKMCLCNQTQSTQGPLEIKTETKEHNQHNIIEKQNSEFFNKRLFHSDGKQNAFRKTFGRSQKKLIFGSYFNDQNAFQDEADDQGFSDENIINQAWSDKQNITPQDDEQAVQQLRLSEYSDRIKSGESVTMKQQSRDFYCKIHYSLSTIPEESSNDFSNIKAKK